MSISSQQDELNRLVGEISGQLKGLERDNERLFKENRVLFKKMDEVGAKVVEVESKVAPLPELVGHHSESIAELKNFDKNLMAILALVGVAASGLATGVWLLITNFPSVIAFAKKLLSGP